jgi:hypothetical protein
LQFVKRSRQINWISTKWQSIDLSSLQILWLLLENTHLETKRSSEDSGLPLYLAG